MEESGQKSYVECEPAIIERCRGGCRDAFELVVKHYMKTAYRIALGVVGNHEDALELSQEAFYLAYRNIRTLKAERSFFPWFYQILRNVCFSHLRKKQRNRELAMGGENGVDMFAADGDWFSPDAVVGRDETKDAVWKAIGKLRQVHREVIVLRHFQNMSYDEIAGVLICSKGTVMSRLHHARRNLKNIMSKGGPLL